MPKVQPLYRPVVACSPLDGRGWKALNGDEDTLRAAAGPCGSQSRGVVSPNASMWLRHREVTPASCVSLRYQGCTDCKRSGVMA